MEISERGINMYFEIFENELNIVDAENNKTVIATFIPEETLKDTKYNLYLYAEVVDKELYLKLGKAVAESVFDRYDTTGHLANRHMVAVWESNKSDTEIHNQLKLKCENKKGYTSANFDILNTKEAYKIESLKGYNNFIDDCNVLIAETGIINKEDRIDYPSVIKLVNETISANKKYITWDLCARWGKTGTWLRTIREYVNKENIHLHIMSAYVGTVKHSYSEEILKVKSNENCLFIDPDLYESTNEIKNAIKNWLTNDKHYVVYYLALTGDEDTCFARRIEPLKSFDINYTVAIEEADFGSTCVKQVKKLQKLFNDEKCKHVIAMTGTKIEKTENLFETEQMIKRDYIVDVLPEEERHAVGLNWYTLNNSKMVEQFNYSCKEMENWTNIFEIKEGKFNEETYLTHLINFLFNKTLPVITKENREYTKHNLLNNAATMIFMPTGNEAHTVMKNLLEKLLPNDYLIKILDLDNTSNSDAEFMVRDAIKDHGNKVIIIASGMANRSFSVPEIKNVILMFNQADPANVVQKVARGLSPWKQNPEMKCNVIDFRLGYQTNMIKWLSEIACNTIEDDAEHTFEEVVEIIDGTDKLTFFEYFTENGVPFRTIDKIELAKQMQTSDYLKSKAMKIVFTDLSSIDNPDARFARITEQLKLNDLVNSNVKGDSSKKVKNNFVNKFVKTPEEKEKISADQRINYLAYLLNHKDRFNSGKYESNILENEFKNNMSTKRIAAIENMFKIDMNVINQIADLLIKNKVEIYG